MYILPIDASLANCLPAYSNFAGSSISTDIIICLATSAECNKLSTSSINPKIE